MGDIAVCEIDKLIQTRHHEHISHVAGRSIGRPERHILLVGGANVLDTDLAHHIFGNELVGTIVRTSSLLDALNRLETGSINLVLLGDEFGIHAVSLFALDACRLGFSGLILRVVSVPNQPEDPIPSPLTSRDAQEMNWGGYPLATSAKTRDRQASTAPQKITSNYQQISASADLSETSLFTARERTVLIHLSEGYSNRQIGNQLHCSETAVKAVVQHLFRKLGVRTRAHVVRVAFEKALLNIPTKVQSDLDYIGVGDFTIDLLAQRVLVRGVDTPLNPREIGLLRLFCAHPTELLKHNRLIKMLTDEATEDRESLQMLVLTLDHFVFPSLHLLTALRLARDENRD